MAAHKPIARGVKATEVHSDDDLSSLSSEGAQAGVKEIEAISLSWTTWSLIMAYVG